MTLRCLIVEDEPNAAKLLEAYIAQVPHLHLVHTCYDASQALQHLHTDRIDLLFLDINLPGLGGMELAEMLPAGPRIIFTTAYTEFAAQSYELHAVDYLLKPITLKRFLAAVGKASEALQPRATGTLEPAAECFFVKSGKQFVRVQYDRILYVEGLKSYVLLVTEDEKIIVYKRMQEMEALLPSHFHRVHLSYIVNVNAIQRIEENHVLVRQARLPISAKYREAFWKVIEQQRL